MNSKKRKNSNLQSLFSLFLLIFITLSCQHDDEKPTKYISKQMVIGKKLNNPYSLRIMKKAYENIKQKYLNNNTNTSKTTSLFDDFEVKTNFLYVKYAPETELEETELKADSTLVLFDYPLDYEFTEEELANRAPLAENEIPQYYAAINITSDQAAEEQYQLLEQLYIPEQDVYFDQISSIENNTPTTPEIINTKQDLLRHLIYEAYELTGNENQLETPDNLDNGRWIFGSKWYPSGAIGVIDEVAGASKAVQGAQVLIRQWFTVRQGITNAYGYFSTGSVRGSARYIIQWERHHYSIRNGSLFQAETRGPVKKNEPWFVHLESGDNKYHALIHQAAHDYYYGHRFGLTSPPRNSATTRQMKIAARETNSDNTGSYSHLRNELTIGIIAQIHIRAWGLPSDQVYGTTIHELAHAAHSELDRGSYDNLVRDAWIIPWNGGAVTNNNRRLLESWARAVEIVMTLDRYKTRFGNTSYSLYKFNLTKNYQNQTISQNNHYTSGIYDMIDNFNQNQGFGELYPKDRVEGYNIKQLELGLIGARYWNAYKNNIVDLYDNPTKIYLTELFNNWQD